MLVFTCILLTSKTARNGKTETAPVKRGLVRKKRLNNLSNVFASKGRKRPFANQDRTGEHCQSVNPVRSFLF